MPKYPRERKSPDHTKLFRKGRDKTHLLHEIDEEITIYYPREKGVGDAPSSALAPDEVHLEKETKD